MRVTQVRHVIRAARLEFDRPEERKQIESNRFSRFRYERHVQNRWRLILNIGDDVKFVVLKEKTTFDFDISGGSTNFRSRDESSFQVDRFADGKFKDFLKMFRFAVLIETTDRAD